MFFYNRFVTVSICTLFISPLCHADQLKLLPIKNMNAEIDDAGTKIEVKYEIQKCKFEYKGIYIEEIPSGESQSLRLAVRVLAKEKISGGCMGPVGLGSDTVLIKPIHEKEYELMAVQP